MDSSLKCGTCGRQLEYADADGTLRAVEGERRCPRCGTVNSKDVRFCESCGAQVGKMCGYCKAYHYIEDKVCPRSGEPIPTAAEDAEPTFTLSRLVMAASVLAMMFFGFMMLNSGRSSTPVPVSSPSPVVAVQGQGPTIDVVFTVDCTGSMGDEIEAVKTKIHEMVRTISSGQPRPRVRYGIVAYRDRGDVFITRKYELTDQMDSITANINELQADGGGDTPESVNEALHVSVNGMNWDSSANTRKMIFLIGDAGPHTDYPNDYDFRTVSREAQEKNIKIFTLGCSGITSSGESEFREIAQLTGGQYDYLTYQQAYTRHDGTKVDVMIAGDKKYEVSGSAEKDEWRTGYRDMLERKKAKELAPPAPAEAPMKPSSDMRNNLDSVLTRQVQMEAEEMGVKYKK